MIFLAMLLVAGVGYGIAGIARKLNLLSRRERRAEGTSTRARALTYDELSAEGTAWTALDDLQLKRLLKDSAS